MLFGMLCAPWYMGVMGAKTDKVKKKKEQRADQGKKL
jgi:hypothetical protein